jgi:hypothetical protein
MSVMAFGAPIKDVNAARELAAELKGDRRAEYVASQRRSGCVRERVFLGESPMGPIQMVYREGLNAGYRVAQLMASSNAFDKYYLETISRISGIDLSTRPAGPISHLAFEWTSGERHRNCTMFMAPVPDASKLWSFLRDVSARPAEHTESRQRMGLCYEQVFYLHDAKMIVGYCEGPDAQKAFSTMLESTSAYDRWFVEQTAVVHGMDLRKQKMTPPELLVLFDA